MNRIKIIKRTNLQLPPAGSKTEIETIIAPVSSRKTAQVVANWIHEWRKQNSKDARRAFADLFRQTPSTVKQ